MSETVFDPIPVTYLGRYADSHFVDAEQFGKSLIGTSKVANSICHFFFFADVTNDPRSYNIRFFVGPSKENGFIQELFAIMNSGHLPVFSYILHKTAKLFIEKTFNAIITRIIGKKDAMDSAIETISEMAHQHADFAQQVHAGHMREKEWLQKLVETLAGINRAPLRDVPQPVGKSVREMRIGSLPNMVQVDEPAAEVLRSHEHLTGGDTDKFRARIEGVFKTNGACRIRLLDIDKVVPGKITDPALGRPGNVYTAALNDGATLLVAAKPTLRDGEIKRLFVSDAEFFPPGLPT